MSALKKSLSTIALSGALIVVGFLLVVTLVSVVQSMIKDDAIKTNRDAVFNDLVNLAARTQQYYRRPVSLGGGGNSFVGLTADPSGIAKLTGHPSNPNGTYSIITGTPRSVVLRGVGTVIAEDGHLIEMEIHVSNTRADSVVMVH